jgi:sugar lactone lactonase YvrE
MRRFHLPAILCSLALLSCSNDSPVGSEPTLPRVPSPANQSTNQPPSLLLSWNGEGGDHFDIYLGPSTSPPLVAHDVSVSHYHPALLAVNTLYYWRVVNVGTDSHVGGALWSFRTRPGVPPAPPSPIAPADGATVALDPVLLTWSPAAGDSLTFNVYFGSETDPPSVASNITESSYSASVLAGNTYYWRIETKNLDGLTNTGPVWHFQADHAPNHIYNVAGIGVEGFGEVSQQPLDTQLFWPQDISFDASGRLVVVDWNNHRVLGTDPNNGTFYLLAGSVDGIQGEPCAFYPVPCDEIGAPESPLNHPTSVLFRPDGNMVLSAWHNSSVFLVDVAGQVMSRIAGTGKLGYDGEEKAANASAINLPSAAVYDTQGRLVFTDQGNMIIRMIDDSGVIHRFAGVAPVYDAILKRYVPQTGFSGDEGPATLAKFKWDSTTTCAKLCVDAAGNIYVADTSNHAIRRIDTAGIIHRFAGLFPASAGFSGDGGPATSAQLTQPRDLACDSEGNVFIADTGNHVIRMVNAQGIISTVVGIPGVTGTSEDDGKVATEAGLNLPYGIEIDSQGKLWIADTENSRIRVVYR